MSFNPVDFETARRNTAMASPNHLKAWLDASGRRWLVLDALALVDSLRWPEGVMELVTLLHAYGQHRSTKPSGRFMKTKDPLTGEMVEVPIPRGDALEVEELDRAIRYLTAQALQLDPSWSLENPAL